MRNHKMPREDELLFILMENTLEYNSDRYAQVLSELLDLLYASDSYKTVVTLCYSNNLTSIRAGAWLASNLGKKAISIYEDIVKLIKHEDPIVRYEIIELILNCSDNGKDLVELIICLNDKEKIVRIRALDYLHFLSPVQINKALTFAKENKLKDVIEVLELFNAILSGDLTINEVLEKLEQYSMLGKKAIVASLIKLGIKNTYLKKIVAKSKNEDLQHYYKYYIYD